MRPYTGLADPGGLSGPRRVKGFQNRRILGGVRVATAAAGPEDDEEEPGRRLSVAARGCVVE